MDNDLRQLIVDYMTEQKLMQLATIGESGPWVCSVWQAFDENLNIYFFSAMSRQHSQEIEQDNRVAGTMAQPQAIDAPPRAVQFVGSAQKLTDYEAIAKARAIYQDRIFDAAKIDTLTVHPERPHAFYKITPSKFVLFDALNFPDNPKREYVITEGGNV